MNIKTPKPKILIVDDDDNWRKTLRDMLGDAYEMQTTSTYAGAVELLTQQAFHVVVADQRLEDADDRNVQGIQLLELIRQFNDGTRTIIVTGFPSADAAKAAFKGPDTYEAYEYLYKYPGNNVSFKVDEYRELVKDALEDAVQRRRMIHAQPLVLEQIIPDSSYEQVAKHLFPRVELTEHVLESVKTHVHRLLTPLRPIMLGQGLLFLIEDETLCDILCWSRQLGGAVVARLGVGVRKYKLDEQPIAWLAHPSQLSLNYKFTSSPFVGASIQIVDIEFNEFLALV